MKWPLVSRRAFDTLASENAWLRAELEKHRDHERRIERKAHGLKEVPATPVEPMDPMPANLLNYVRSFAPGAIRDRHERDLYAARRQHGTWAAVEAIMADEIAEMMEEETV